VPDLVRTVEGRGAPLWPAYGLLNDRLSLFPPLLLVLWCARPAPAHRAERVAVAVLLVGTAALVGLRIPTEARYQSDVAEE